MSLYTFFEPDSDSDDEPLGTSCCRSCCITKTCLADDVKIHQIDGNDQLVRVIPRYLTFEEAQANPIDLGDIAIPDEDDDPIALAAAGIKYFDFNTYTAQLYVYSNDDDIPSVGKIWNGNETFKIALEFSREDFFDLNEEELPEATKTVELNFNHRNDQLCQVQLYATFKVTPCKTEAAVVTPAPDGSTTYPDGNTPENPKRRKIVRDGSNHIFTTVPIANSNSPQKTIQKDAWEFTITTYVNNDWVERTKRDPGEQYDFIYNFPEEFENSDTAIIKQVFELKNKQNPDYACNDTLELYWEVYIEECPPTDADFGEVIITTLDEQQDTAVPLKITAGQAQIQSETSFPTPRKVIKGQPFSIRFTYNSFNNLPYPFNDKSEPQGQQVTFQKAYSFQAQYEPDFGPNPQDIPWDDWVNQPRVSEPSSEDPNYLAGIQWETFENLHPETIPDDQRMYLYWHLKIKLDDNCVYYRTVAYPIIYECVPIARHRVHSSAPTRRIYTSIDDRPEITDPSIAHDGFSNYFNRNNQICVLKIRDVSVCGNETTWVIDSPGQGIYSQFPMQATYAIEGQVGAESIRSDVHNVQRSGGFGPYTITIGNLQPGQTNADKLGIAIELVQPRIFGIYNIRIKQTRRQRNPDGSIVPGSENTTWSLMRIDIENNSINAPWIGQALPYDLVDFSSDPADPILLTGTTIEPRTDAVNRIASQIASDTLTDYTKCRLIRSATLEAIESTIPFYWGMRIGGEYDDGQITFNFLDQIQDGVTEDWKIEVLLNGETYDIWVKPTDTALTVDLYNIFKYVYPTTPVADIAKLYMLNLKCYPPITPYGVRMTGLTTRLPDDYKNMKFIAAKDCITQVVLTEANTTTQVDTDYDKNLVTDPDTKFVDYYPPSNGGQRIRVSLSINLNQFNQDMGIWILTRGKLQFASPGNNNDYVGQGGSLPYMPNLNLDSLPVNSPFWTWHRPDSYAVGYAHVGDFVGDDKAIVRAYGYTQERIQIGGIIYFDI